MKSLLSVAAIILAFLLCCPSQSEANLINDGDFLAAGFVGSFRTYSAGEAMGGWKVVSGNVDLIGTYWQQPSPGVQR